jgi:hypothetical protein
MEELLWGLGDLPDVIASVERDDVPVYSKGRVEKSVGRPACSAA